MPLSVGALASGLVTAIPEQSAFWNGVAGDRWVRLAPELDHVLGPFGDAAIDAAALREGERVLDVGCGCGATTLELAERVGAAGRVVGIDLSAPMLARAGERSAARGRTSAAPIELVLGDASTHELATGGFDVVYSRFGVMFFDEPARAFAHLATSLRPGGRLAFVCWRPMKENAWATVPLAAALPFLPPTPPEPPDAPGPFAFGDADRVRAILAAAGFEDVSLVAYDAQMALGSGRSLSSAVDYAMQIGVIARRIADLDETTRARVREAVSTALAPHVGADGGRLGAACWIVTARR